MTTSTHQMGGQAAPAQAQHTPGHTPGPWDVMSGCYEHADWFNGASATGISYYVVAANQTSMQARANTRLIAAAPDMLAALGKVRACLASTHGAIPCDPRNPEFIQYVDDICRAAIAKATATH